MHNAAPSSGLSLATLLLATLAACSAPKPPAAPSFHPLPALSYVYNGKDYQGTPYSIKNDYVLIANPPADRKALLALVEAYDKQTLSPAQLAPHLAYIREYYRESEKMPRTYQESRKDYFHPDRLEDHAEDRLLTVKWKDHGQTRSIEFPETP